MYFENCFNVQNPVEYFLFVPHSKCKWGAWIRSIHDRYDWIFWHETTSYLMLPDVVREGRNSEKQMINRWNRMQAINNEYSVCLCTHYFISSTVKTLGHFPLLMSNESIYSETKLLLYWVVRACFRVWMVKLNRENCC